ncbi:MAG: NADPH-dependent F420 reductase [Vicinamibacterales bacterium]
MRIGVIGSGQVGQTLSQGLAKHGYELRIASRSPAKLAEFSSTSGIPTGTFADVAAWAEVIVLAVKGDAADAALREAGAPNVAGKLVIDTTNPIASEPPEDGVLKFFTSPNDSLMERLQRAFPDARLVKAFNSVGSALMIDPAFPGGVKPTMFYCGDDAGAKEVAARILDDLGWDVADMGTAKAARAIEPLCQLWCIPGFRENAWTNHAFALLKR